MRSKSCSATKRASHWPYLALAVVACGSPRDAELFSSDPLPVRDSSPAEEPCSIDGFWATFVELGVEWQSGVIRPGAGTVRQWVLSERRAGVNGEVLDTSRACGVGAHGVPLGSPWFSTIELASLPKEWMGAQFLPQLFDRNTLPTTTAGARMIGADPQKLEVGKGMFQVDAAPYSFGLEGLSPDAAWPKLDDIIPFMVDHDGDGYPGLAGIPFSGQVPGEAAGVSFVDPRVEIDLSDSEIAKNPPRASRLFLALRTRVSISATLVSCEPTARFEGAPDPTELRIETRNVGCMIAGTGELCTKTQLAFIDANLPKFEPNGTGIIISVKVSPETTCEDVRNMGLERDYD